MPGTTREIPAPGPAWVDAPLLDALHLKPGRRAAAGRRQPAHRRLIVIEPDRGAGFMNFAPRVMLNAGRPGATGLVQPASRVTYRLAVAGDGAAGAVREFVPGPTRRSSRAAARRARRVAGERPARDAPDAGPRREVPEPGGAAGGAAGGGGGGASRRATSPSATWTTAPCCACWACQRTHRRRLHAGVRPGRPAGQRRAWLLGFGVHFVFVLLLAGLVDAQLPPASPGRRCSAWAWA
jgi:putative ABC transport system permease protein